jgi:hypothetical protein
METNTEQQESASEAFEDNYSEVDEEFPDSPPPQ